jgi:hypothetical protein
MNQEGNIIMVCANLLIIGSLAQLSPSADPLPIPVSGLVVDASQKPVVGADLWLTRATRAEDDPKSGMELFWAARASSDDQEHTSAFAHARSDSEGRFRLEVPTEIAARPAHVALVVWAVSPGSRISSRRLPRVLRPDDPPIRLTLGPAAQSELTIFGPDGQAIAGAKVVPSCIQEMPIPNAMGERLAGTTDLKGRVILAGVPRDALCEVRVDAPGLGTQRIALGGEKETIVTLAPVGCIKGRLVAPEGDTQGLVGVTIRVRSRVGGFDGSGRSSEALVSCDPSGQFEVPALAAGIVTFDLIFDRDKGVPLRGELTQRLVLRVGSKAEVMIPLRPSVRVSGIVREKGSGRPIAGVKLLINGRFGGDRCAVSNAQGKYTAFVRREVNQPFGWPIRIPRPFYQPTNAPEAPQSMPPRGVNAFSLPTMELARGVDLAGTVIDEAGKPVADAEVEAISGSSAIVARSNSAGVFVLAGVDPLAELKITARASEMKSGPPQTLRAEDTRGGPLALKVRKGQAGLLGGRVVDPSRRPIAGASVWIWRMVHQDGRVFLREPVTGQDGTIVLRTGADGRYRVSHPLPLGDEYVADAEALGRFSAHSASLMWTGPSQAIPDLVLTGLKTVAGQVVDRQGQPIAGVTVRQSGDGPLRTETRTDARGQFQLPGVIEGPVIMFASKEGYRLGAQIAESDSSSIKVTLTRAGDPPAISYRTLDSPLPITAEKALARRVFEPYAERVLAVGKYPEKYRVMVDAVQIDPAAVVERLESIKLTEALHLNLARVQLAEALAKENLDEALAQAEAGTDADTRAWCYLGICDVLRDLAKPRLRELTDQALLNARAMKSPADRVMFFGRIADKLIDLGDKERARRLLAETEELARPTVKGIKAGGYNLGIAAEALARLDLPAALKMIDDLAREAKKNDKVDRAYVFVRIYGAMAYKIAADAPADAERVLERFKSLDPTNYDGSVVAACWKMANIDPDRAERIAKTMMNAESIELKPYALGLIAGKLAATDRDKTRARRLLDEAYDELDRLAETGRTSPMYTNATVAGALLPVVEQVAPDRLPEFLARTLMLREPRRDDSDEASSVHNTAMLAMLIGRYDRDLAARLLRPALAQLETIRGRSTPDYISFRVLAALATIDPRQAVERIEAMPDDPSPGTSSDTPKNMARTWVAQLLARHGKDRWQRVYEYFVYLWTPDQRYL